MNSRRACDLAFAARSTGRKAPRSKSCMVPKRSWESTTTQSHSPGWKSGFVAPSAGLSNAGGIDLSGTGTGKTGLLISGGHSYFGNINFNTVLVANSNGQVSTTGSSMLVVGDGSVRLEGDGPARPAARLAP